MGGPVENCLGGGMHMQTCKHEDIKKTKKAKGKKEYMKRILNPGLWNQSLGLLPTKLPQDLTKIKNQRVYSILKKKKRLTMRTIHRSCHGCPFPKPPPPPLLQATAVTPPGRKPIFAIPFSVSHSHNLWHSTASPVIIVAINHAPVTYW